MINKMSDCASPGCELGLVDWWEQADPLAETGTISVGKCSGCGTVQVQCECGELVAVDAGKTGCTTCAAVYEADGLVQDVHLITAAAS